MSRVRRGDEHAFGELVHRYRNWLYDACFLRADDEHHALQLTMAVLGATWGDRTSLDPGHWFRESLRERIPAALAAYPSTDPVGWNDRASAAGPVTASTVTYILAGELAGLVAEVESTRPGSRMWNQLVDVTVGTMNVPVAPAVGRWQLDLSPAPMARFSGIVGMIAAFAFFAGTAIMDHPQPQDDVASVPTDETGGDQAQGPLPEVASVGTAAPAGSGDDQSEPQRTTASGAAEGRDIPDAIPPADPAADVAAAPRTDTPGETPTAAPDEPAAPTPVPGGAPGPGSGSEIVQVRDDGDVAAAPPGPGTATAAADDAPAPSDDHPIAPGDDVASVDTGGGSIAAPAQPDVEEATDADVGGDAPVTCDAPGVDDVNYTIFVNGVDIGADLRVATLLPGDEVVVTGTVSPDCVDALTGSLAIATYGAPSAGFDPMVNQSLAGADRCDEDCLDADGTFTLRHVVVDPGTCGWQVDVVLGPVLETVGPDGGYYSAALSGGPDRLLTADNGGLQSCTA